MLILRIIGVVYIILGVWCSLLPDQTSQSVGFELINGSGMSEYITVYGGLEVGLGLAMLITSFVARLRLGGLAFTFILSACLPLFRVPTILVFDVQSTTYALMAVEIAFAILLGLALWRELRKCNTKSQQL